MILFQCEINPSSFQQKYFLEDWKSPTGFLTISCKLHVLPWNFSVPWWDCSSGEVQPQLLAHMQTSTQKDTWLLRWAKSYHWQWIWISFECIIFAWGPGQDCRTVTPRLQHNNWHFGATEEKADQKIIRDTKIRKDDWLRKTNSCRI